MSDIILHDKEIGGNQKLGMLESAYILNEFVKVLFQLPLYACLFLRSEFDEISTRIHPNLRYLKETVFSEIWHKLECYNNEYFSEKSLYYKFSTELSSILPGAEIIEYKKIKEHIPDFMITYQGHVMPVEIKLGRFTNPALKQLQRYMREYKSKRGVAVSSEGGVKLPDNIQAIDLEPSAPIFNPRNVPRNIFDKVNPLMVEMLGLSSIS